MDGLIAGSNPIGKGKGKAAAAAPSSSQAIVPSPLGSPSGKVKALINKYAGKGAPRRSMILSF